MLATFPVHQTNVRSDFASFNAKAATVSLVICVFVSMILILALARGHEAAKSRYIEKKRQEGSVSFNKFCFRGMTYRTPAMSPWSWQSWLLYRVSSSTEKQTRRPNLMGWIFRAEASMRSQETVHERYFAASERVSITG
jgi:hypothetical protein